MVWNPFPFKGDLSFRKIQKSQGTKSGLLGVWVTWVIWCFATKHCKRHDAWVGALPWWSCQLPVAHNCGLLNHPNSFLRRMFKLNAKFDADSFLYSVILIVTATQYTCSLNGIYHPHWPVKLLLFTHVHSSRLSLAARLHQCCTNHSCYISNGWTFSGQTSYFHFAAWSGLSIKEH